MPPCQARPPAVSWWWAARCWLHPLETPAAWSPAASRAATGTAATAATARAAALATAAAVAMWRWCLSRGMPSPRCLKSSAALRSRVRIWAGVRAPCCMRLRGAERRDCVSAASRRAQASTVGMLQPQLHACQPQLQACRTSFWRAPLTLPPCTLFLAAGGVVKQLLDEHGERVGAYRVFSRGDDVLPVRFRCRRRHPPPPPAVAAACRRRLFAVAAAPPACRRPPPPPPLPAWVLICSPTAEACLWSQ